MGIVIATYAIIILSFVFDLWLSILNYGHRNAPIPEVVKDIYNKEEYEKWHKYYIANFKFGLIAKSINTFVFVLLLGIGYFTFIDNVASNITSNYELQVVIFLGLYYVITYVIGIFTSYYDSFVIEESFGFNKTTKSTFIKDKIKGLILTIIFGGGLVYGLAALYENVSSMFFLYAFIGLVLIILFINLFYVKLIVPIFNKLKPMEDSELKTKIEEFAKSAGYEINKISIMDASRRSSKLNAYFSGMGKLKQVVLYDTLVEKCSEEEVVAVLAHEIGHNKHKHIIFNLISMVFMIALYVGLLVLLLSFDIFSTAFGFADTNFGFTLILFTVFITPIMIPINILRSWISRKFEYQADRFAATKYKKEPMISALKVLSRENFSNLTPHPLYVKMFYSHPPTNMRIDAINKVEG